MSIVNKMAFYSVVNGRVGLNKKNDASAVNAAKNKIRLGVDLELFSGNKRFHCE